MFFFFHQCTILQLFALLYLLSSLCSKTKNFLFKSHCSTTGASIWSIYTWSNILLLVLLGILLKIMFDLKLSSTSAKQWKRFSSYNFDISLCWIQSTKYCFLGFRIIQTWSWILHLKCTLLLNLTPSLSSDSGYFWSIYFIHSILIFFLESNFQIRWYRRYLW